MSSSQINNGKRHVCDRATYSGAPNQKKRIKFINPDEQPKKEKYLFKYNFESLIALFLIMFGWEGDSTMKILAMLFAFVAGWSYTKEV